MKNSLPGWFLLLLACPAANSQSPARHVVLIDIDGVRRDTFAKAYQEGRLPNFQRIFGEALWYDNATTVVPTVTMAAQASIATGTPPWRHGVPGNQWFDRKTGRLYNYLNSSGITCVYGYTLMAGQECLNGIGNTHLWAPTVYEAAAAAGLTSLAAYMPYWKGTARPAAPTAAEASSFLKNNSLDHRRFDAQMAARAVADIRSQGMPAILAVYFGGADIVGHKEGIAAQTPYLAQVVDPGFGEILDAVAGADPQWPVSTMFILTSDHGRTDVVPHPEDTAVAADLAAALPPHAHIAANGGVVYVYLEPADGEPIPEVAARLAGNAKLAVTIASVRLRNAEDSSRAGDLILTLRQGHYYMNSAAGSQHGSVYADDLAIPLVVASPGVPGAHIREPAGVTQIARTIAQYLGFAMESADPPLPLENRSKTATRH